MRRLCVVTALLVFAASVVLLASPPAALAEQQAIEIDKVSNGGFPSISIDTGKVAWIKHDVASDTDTLWLGTSAIDKTLLDSTSTGSLQWCSLGSGQVAWVKKDASNTDALWLGTSATSKTQLDSISTGAIDWFVLDGGQVAWVKKDASTNTYSLWLGSSATNKSQLDSTSSGSIKDVRLNAGHVAWIKHDSSTDSDTLWVGTGTADKAQLDSPVDGAIEGVALDAGQVAWIRFSSVTMSHSVWLGTSAVDKIALDYVGSVYGEYGFIDGVSIDAGQVAWTRFDPGTYTDPYTYAWSLWLGTRAGERIRLDYTVIRDLDLITIRNNSIDSVSLDAGRVAWVKHDGDNKTDTLWLGSSATDKSQLDSASTGAIHLPFHGLAADHTVWERTEGYGSRLLVSSEPPQQPSNISPTPEALIALTPTLSSSSYSDPQGDAHIASQWRITTTSGNETVPVFESGADTTNLTSITIPDGVLAGGTTYRWQVRYQDQWGAWSPYSTETTMVTAKPEITGVAPPASTQGTKLDVIVTGDQLIGVTELDFGAGIAVVRYNVDNSSLIRAAIAVDPTAVVGARDVSVTTSGGVCTLPGAFTVAQAPPSASPPLPPDPSQGNQEQNPNSTPNPTELKDSSLGDSSPGAEQDMQQQDLAAGGDSQSDKTVMPVWGWVVIGLSVAMLGLTAVFLMLRKTLNE